MNHFKALDGLLDILVKAIKPEEFNDLLDDMRDVELGRRIVMNVNTDAGHKIKFKRLLKSSGKHDGGLDLLLDALRFNTDKTLNDWPDLERAFRAYQDAMRDSGQANHPDLTTSILDISDLGATLRTRLQDLASKHHHLEPERLQEAIARAMERAYQGACASKKFPSVFGQGPIKKWADLLQRTCQDPFALDQSFLDAFDEALASSSSAPGQPDPSEVSSLMLMVLRPPHLPASEECQEYAFRAYFCPHDGAMPEQWIRLDARVSDYPIRAAAWTSDLRPLIIKAIADASYQRQCAHAPLLLEIFLPTKFLNQDIGELITMQLPTGEWESISKYYPIVLRSSERYQYFHEGQAKGFPFPLPAKWKEARRRPAPAAPSCSWWHDPTPASRSHSQKAEKEIETHFETLRLESKYFALKRAANLPTCPQLQQKWLDRMIWACPAVALWWRPKAQCGQIKRRESLQFSCGEHDQLFGFSQLAADQPAHADRFMHPGTDSPLKLFHAFANTVFHGRRSPVHSQAFRDLVLLMDSEERWPPPVDASLSIQRRTEEGRDVITAHRDEILYSD